MLTRHTDKKRKTLALVGALGGAAIAIGALAVPGQAVDDEVSADLNPVRMLTVEEADSIIDEFNRTGLVEGSESPTVRNDFQSEPPDEVFELADSLREKFGESRGYGPVQWDRRDRSVSVWWHGDVPDRVIELVNQASEFTDAPIALSAMDHSKQDLAVAAQEILASPSANQYEIQSATALFDGSGIEVASSAPAPVLRTLSTHSTSDKLGASQAFPVRVVESGEVEQAVDRQGGHLAPYAGGGRIHRVGGTACTAGFGVMIADPVPVQDKPRGMMSAHHCGGGGWSTPAGTFFGYMAPTDYGSPHKDVAVMVNSEFSSGVPDTFPIYFPMMWVGDWDAGSRFIVVSGQTPVIGADWCTSGSFSGTFCYNEVMQTDVYADYGNPPYSNVGPLVETKNWWGDHSVGSGDSGGPAYRYMAPNSNGVFATGIISGVRNGDNNCEGYQSPTRVCSDRALISPIYPALATLNGDLTLMTNTNY